MVLSYADLQRDSENIIFISIRHELREKISIYCNYEQNEEIPRRALSSANSCNLFVSVGNILIFSFFETLRSTCYTKPLAIFFTHPLDFLPPKVQPFMGRRKRGGCSSDEYDSSDEEWSPSPKKVSPLSRCNICVSVQILTNLGLHQRSKQSQPSNAPKPPTKAAIVILATDVPPDQSAAREKCQSLCVSVYESSFISAVSVGKIDNAVLGRMKKALALASHAGTSEQEAKAALR
jgi:hypothetical protein